ncbi:MAG: hypothetical protein QMD23_06370, partial [Candidatus Bathyarchaeia archaeon]|nr:hypothetical protein [Candidatus Bathyarchaeia archaeon]
LNANVNTQAKSSASIIPETAFVNISYLQTLNNLFCKIKLTEKSSIVILQFVCACACTLLCAV